MPTDFTDATFFSFLGPLQAPNTSSSVQAAVEADVLGLKVSQGPKSPISGAVVLLSGIAISHQAIAAIRVEVFGGLIFERIIVVPRTKTLGFVLTATEFSIEVWNSSRDVEQDLTSITDTGPGGIVLTNPYSFPTPYAPGRSIVYFAITPQAGNVGIDQIFSFVFSSGIPGADCEVLGSRIVLFSVAPDWSGGIIETIDYLTDVLRAYSEKEQRRALRQLPRRGLKFHALALNARDAAGMESLIWGWQQQPFGVPWWPDVTPLTADLAPGSYSIPCDTTDRQFVAGGLVALWKDEFTFESFIVEEVFADHLTITAPTQFAWTAAPQTLVIPVFLGRVSPSVTINRLSSEIDGIDLEFAGESMQPSPPLPPAGLPTFKGFPVLEQMPNWEKAQTRDYKRSLAILDPKVGPITVIDKTGSPVVSHPFPWFLENHAAITVFRAFLFAAFGQLNSFWIPTWDQDLVLALDVASIDGAIRIASMSYSRFFFPNAARRFLAFIPIDGSSNVYRKITAAADNGDGTETLTLESATGKFFGQKTTQLSFLTLARLGSDDNSIEWFSNDLAQSELPIREVPREVPV
jgi:hypothetical protein